MHYERNGSYTVKSAYRLTYGLVTELENISWKKLWKSEVLPESGFSVGDYAKVGSQLRKDSLDGVSAPQPFVKFVIIILKQFGTSLLIVILLRIAGNWEGNGRRLMRRCTESMDIGKYF